MHAVCHHFPCPTPMFLTTPKYVLKPSSSISLSRCLFPSFSIFLLSSLPTATKLHPIKLSLYFKIHFYSISTMWHSVCLDDLCPPLSRPPPVPPCCCFQDPRFLDPPCTYSPTLNITLPAGASSAFLRDHPDPGHARSGLSHDVLTPLRP